MRIKTVETVLTTNTAGQVVESLPVREVEAAVQNAAGQWVDPIDVEEADDGVPVRFVEDAVTTNSVGHPVAATPVKGGGWGVHPIVAWGDSLTGPTGVGATESYPVQAGALFDPDRIIKRRQLGGQTSTQIAAAQGGITLTASVADNELPEASKVQSFTKFWSFASGTTDASALGSVTITNESGWLQTVCTATDTGLLINPGSNPAQNTIIEYEFEIELTDGHEVKVLGSQAAGTTNTWLITESGSYKVVCVPTTSTTNRLRFASNSGAQTFRVRNVRVTFYGLTGGKALSFSPDNKPWTTGSRSMLATLAGIPVLVAISGSTYTAYQIETASAAAISAGSSFAWDWDSLRQDEVPPLRSHTAWIWAGRNDADSPSGVEANIAAMVSHLGHSRYLVAGILTGSGDSGGKIAGIEGLNTDLAATYGNRFVDLLAILKANGDGSANDNADIAAGLVPRSLRSDTVHLNASGYGIVADAMVSATLARGG